MGAQVRILGPIEVVLPGGRRADVPRGRTLAAALRPAGDPAGAAAAEARAAALRAAKRGAA